MILFLQLRLIYTIITDVLKCSVCSQNNDQKLQDHFIHYIYSREKSLLYMNAIQGLGYTVVYSLIIKHNSTASIFRIKQSGSL